MNTFTEYADWASERRREKNPAWALKVSAYHIAP